MLKAPTDFIVVFILISVGLIFSLFVFIAIVIYQYQRRQNVYLNDIKILKATHENILLQSQLEIQEQTFQTISREIHDNIGQKLSLAKLHLNMLSYTRISELKKQVQHSVNIISEAVSCLTLLSRSLSSEILLNNGLIKALELEVSQLKKTGIYQAEFSVTGNPVFLDKDTELMLFRMAQEALNNVIKHAETILIDVNLHYTSSKLILKVLDCGKGFDTRKTTTGTGLHNISKRTAALKGSFSISSTPGAGTTIKIEIPLTK